MSIHASLGLCKEKRLCKYHGATMKAHREPVPWFVVTNEGRQSGIRPMRTIWRCKVKGCNVMSCGATDVSHAAKEYTLETLRPWA